MEKIKKKYSKTDCLILGIGFLILGLFVLSIAIPIVYVVLASFMDPTVLNNQGLSFHIKDWTLDAYRRVLENEMIWRGFLNSFLYSLAFTAISVFITLLAAYPLSKKEFVGRKLFNLIFLTEASGEIDHLFFGEIRFRDIKHHIGIFDQMQGIAHQHHRSRIEDDKLVFRFQIIDQLIKFHHIEQIVGIWSNLAAE